MTRFNLLASVTLLAGALVAPMAHAGAVHDANLFTNVLARNDDGSTGQVAMGFTANINGTNYTQTYVNNNGNITFNNPLAQFTPEAISTGSFGPIIAAFFADVDTRGLDSDVVRYGAATLGGRNVFGVNYINVGVFSTLQIYNSFQMILTDRSDIGAGDFDIQFNYDAINWESGQASGSNGQGTCGAGSDPACVSALAGYWTGASSNATLAGSLVHGALLDGGANALVRGSLNSNVLGQYNFQVRNGVVVPNDVPEPGALALVGLALAGLALTSRKKRAA